MWHTWHRMATYINHCMMHAACSPLVQGVRFACRGSCGSVDRPASKAHFAPLACRCCVLLPLRCMGKKARHVSEPDYYVPAPNSSHAPLKRVSKKQALLNARASKTKALKKLDPKQRGRAKQAFKGKRGKGKGKK